MEAGPTRSFLCGTHPCWAQRRPLAKLCGYSARWLGQNFPSARVPSQLPAPLLKMCFLVKSPVRGMRWAQGASGSVRQPGHPSALPICGVCGDLGHS